jgi:hypothetical protein
MASSPVALNVGSGAFLSVTSNSKRVLKIAFLNVAFKAIVVFLSTLLWHSFCHFGGGEM